MPFSARYIFTTRFSPLCIIAKRAMDIELIEFSIIKLWHTPHQKRFFLTNTNAHIMPVISEGKYVQTEYYLTRSGNRGNQFKTISIYSPPLVLTCTEIKPTFNQTTNSRSPTLPTTYINNQVG